MAIISTGLSLFATTWSENVDKLVKVLSKDFPALWVLIIFGILAYAIKQLIDFNKGNHKNKIEVHDSFDQNTFQNAVVPLMFELNSELKPIALSNMQLSGHENPDQIIEEYEKTKVEHASDADLSTLENSIRVTEALSKMLSIKRKVEIYDNCYMWARKCLQFGVSGLAVNLLVGVILVVSNNVFEATLLSRVLVILWTVAIFINTILTIVYIVLKTRMDGFIDEV